MASTQRQKADLTKADEKREKKFEAKQNAEKKPSSLLRKKKVENKPLLYKRTGDTYPTTIGAVSLDGVTVAANFTCTLSAEFIAAATSKITILPSKSLKKMKELDTAARAILEQKNYERKGIGGTE